MNSKEIKKREEERRWKNLPAAKVGRRARTATRLRMVDGFLFHLADGDGIGMGIDPPVFIVKIDVVNYSINDLEN